MDKGVRQQLSARQAMYIQPGESGHTHKLHLPKAWARPCGLPAMAGHQAVQPQTLDMRKPATELRPQASMIALAFFAFFMAFFMPAFFMPAFFMTLLAFFAFFMAFTMALTLRRSNEEEEIKFASH